MYMSKYVREIVETPFVVIENEPIEEVNPKPPQLRRTHTLSCTHCGHRWGDVIYEGTNYFRICNFCEKKIGESVEQIRKNNKITLDVTQKQ